MPRLLENSTSCFYANESFIKLSEYDESKYENNSLILIYF